MNTTNITKSFRGDWAGAAEAISVDLLMVGGASDHVVTRGPAKKSAGLMGGEATLIVFENDCGHDIPGCEMSRRAR